jgi:hypothetical protein
LHLSRVASCCFQGTPEAWGIAYKIEVRSLVFECLTPIFWLLTFSSWKGGACGNSVALESRSHEGRGTACCAAEATGLHMVCLGFLVDAALHLFSRAESVCSSTLEHVQREYQPGFLASQLGPWDGSHGLLADAL